MDYKYFEDFVSDAEAKGSLGIDPGTIDAFDDLTALASEPGEAHAIYLLGRFYELGIGIEPDAQEGLNRIIEAAEEGDAEAQYELGGRYNDGDGVTEDPIEAVKWFSEAAEQGHVCAQVMLGVYYGAPSKAR